jgi:DNA-binding Lrp family transcriptional regulator
MPPVTRTERDKEILDALVHRVRVFSLPQVARTWWREAKSPERSALERLARLEAAGLIKLYRALAHPEITLPCPVISWRNGDDTPDFASAAYKLKSRWTEPPMTTVCVIATRLAGRHLGGSGGRVSRGSEQTHDIHLSSVFLSLRATDSNLVPRWQSEASILRSREEKREKLPDALLSLPGGPKVIEFGGAYPKGKLAEFHDYCELASMPYEVW